MSKFQFRRRMKITKGISLNVSKRGLGVSAGPKGLKVSRSATGALVFRHSWSKRTGVSFDGASRPMVVDFNPTCFTFVGLYIQ